MKNLVLIAAAFLANSAFAKVSLRVPILLTAGYGNYSVSTMQSQLEKAGLELPEFIIMKSNKETERLDHIDAQIDEADLEKNGKSLYLQRYGRIGDFQGKGVDYPICYKRSPKTSVKAGMQEAFKLVNSLPSVLFSDQYVIHAYRFHGDRKMRFTDEDSWEKDQMDRFNREFSKTPLQPGDVQVVASLTDDGTDTNNDVLQVCAE